MIVKLNKYNKQVPEFEGIKDSVKDLITKMICPVSKRLTAEEVLQHNWMKINLEAN